MKRQCSDCQLCCKLVPVAELHKKAGVRCEHQQNRLGCRIYPRRPLSCQAWNCAWLVDPFTEHLKRPDRAGYVIDMLPDFFKATNPEGVTHKVPCIQVWLDPKRPKAWEEDKALRDYLAKRGEDGLAVLMRWDSHKAFVLWPPALTGTGEWARSPTGVGTEEHRFDEVLAALQDNGVRIIMKTELQP